MAAVLIFALALLIGASERIEIRGGKLPAPGPERCIRLHATGPFRHVTVRVNGANAGELANQDSELDITGYLSPGAANSVTVEGRVERVWAWISPPVYISSAQLVAGGWLEVTVANTTENTAQVEIGEHQFTVSPGTSASRRLRWTGDRRIRIRAVSDGLDREFIDEADAVEPVLR